MNQSISADGAVVDRLQFRLVAPRRASATLAEIAREGLLAPRKRLPSHLLYNAEGSRIFDLITELPEYYLTRCEREILLRYADEMVEKVGGAVELVEFGCGSGDKTRAMIRAANARQGRVRYVPIDISGEHLGRSVDAWLGEFDDLVVHALAAEYSDGLAELPSPESARLFLFMGSNVGNMERQEAVAFLGDVRRAAGPADRLLIGFDLVKDPAKLWAAYNDSQGVTASFSLNLLHRLNTELNADFDVAQFQHRADYVAAKERIEVCVVSQRAQCVELPRLGARIHFEPGEDIWTEISQKYTLESMGGLMAEAGFEMDEVWQDERGWFAVAMARPNPIAASAAVSMQENG